MRSHCIRYLLGVPILATCSLTAVSIMWPPPAVAAPEERWLTAGQTLTPGTRLVSPNAAFTLEMQTDGNLVQYGPRRSVMWSTRTFVPGTVLRLQEDGNLVLIAPGNNPIWATATERHSRNTLELQSDGNLVVYAQGHRAIWQRSMGGYRIGPPSPTLSFKYVALGDSFSSGEGIEPFLDPSRCHRSASAYPNFVTFPGVKYVGQSIKDLSLRNTNHQWSFLACAGATTANLLRTPNNQEPYPQLEGDRARKRFAYELPVDSRTGLITVTIGGNDVAFSKVLQHCYWSKDCTTQKIGQESLSQYVDARLSELSGRLDEVYSRIGSQAPGATVVVLGYPQLFPATNAEQKCIKLRQLFDNGFTNKEQDALREATVALNAKIRERVEATRDQRFLFVDVAELFDGHEICGAKGEWINAGTLSGKDAVSGKAKLNDQSFHPNAAGHKAYAEAVNRAISPQVPKF